MLGGFIKCIVFAISGNVKLGETNIISFLETEELTFSRFFRRAQITQENPTFNSSPNSAVIFDEILLRGITGHRPLTNGHLA
jgi:hypothetical protein